MSGPRWELALALLQSGEASVRLGNVEMRRSTSGPLADGRISVTVGVGERVSEAVARDALRRAHETVDAAATSDGALAELLLQHGTCWEVVHNCGMGTV